jgi:hypothetical protein
LARTLASPCLGRKPKARVATLIFKLEERKCILLEMHYEIGHFGQHQTFAKVYKNLYWHNQTKQVTMVVKACKKC